MSEIAASVVSQPMSASVSGAGGISSVVSASVVSASVVSSSSISAAVGSSAIGVSVGGGIGPQGPSGATLSDATPLAPGTAAAGTAATASRSDHRHAAPAIGDISGLQAAIDGKQASGSYAAASHAHTASQISDFATAVAAAAPSTTNASLLTSGTLSDQRLSGFARSASSLYLWANFR